jgi:nicotinamidase-related amidase
MFLGKESSRADRRSASLLDADRSILLIIDAQEKFRGAIAEMETLGARIVILAKAAARLGIPVLVTEQYPKALGPTLPEIKASLPAGTPVFEKLTFSAGDAPGWMDALQKAMRASKRDQFVLCGVESHVCVLQTALDLIQNVEGQVYVVEDAVGSRKAADKEAAHRRLEGHAVQWITSEMAFFEWLRKAGTAEFKELQGLIK